MKIWAINIIVKHKIFPELVWTFISELLRHLGPKHKKDVSIDNYSKKPSHTNTFQCKLGDLLGCKTMWWKFVCTMPLVDAHANQDPTIVCIVFVLQTMLVEAEGCRWASLLIFVMLMIKTIVRLLVMSLIMQLDYRKGPVGRRRGYSE